MSERRPRNPIARLFALLRGALSAWVRDRERRSPRAVYEDAIGQRTRQYAELKRAVAGILYARNKLDGEIGRLRAEGARAQEEIRAAVRAGDDEAALVLIRRRQALADELGRAEREIEAMRGEAEEAKANLVRFREEIRVLEREKVRALAALANARARRRMQEAFEGLSLEGEMRALEEVRSHIAELQAEGHLDRELDQDGLAARLRRARDEADGEAARRELNELKRQLRPVLLPAARGTVLAAAPAAAGASD